MEAFVFITELTIWIRTARKKKSKTYLPRIILQIAFLFTILNFFQLTIARCLCGTSNPPKLRIVGGITARPHEFPWQAALVGRRGSIFCGGSLLNSRYVVTAAHCIADFSAWHLSVVLGEHNPREPNKWRRIVKVDDLIVHPYYNGKIYYDDIGLVKMERSVMLTATQKPACLLRPSIDLDGVMGVVSGWGRLVEDGERPDALMKVKIPIISLGTCRQAYGYYRVPSSVICTMCYNGGRDACQGDSGSPMVYQRKKRSYLIGIVSWGIGCARPDHPGILTRVDKYYSWLDENTQDGELCSD